MQHIITVLPAQVHIKAQTGENLLHILRAAGLAPDAPCGGLGTCGKCLVTLNGREVLACQTVVDRDMAVTLPQPTGEQILTAGTRVTGTLAADTYLLACDIGTTTVALWLLDGSGRELGCSSRKNPQAAFGADVISRISHAIKGDLAALTAAIGSCLDEMTRELCRQANVEPCKISRVSVVGNPAMQQLFLGISPENLAKIPFDPVLKEARIVPAKQHLPICSHADLLIVPDISGYVGADAVACVMAASMDSREELTLLVDVGTNAEMVLGNRHRMAACAAAAGPALEGANIRFGMRAVAGAIDHVYPENGKMRCSVIGGGQAQGICGSGLIDAVAAALELGLLDHRGRVQTADRNIYLTDRIYLTQEDIRQVQLAKGAIAAGILQMAAHLGVTLEDIHRVYLAGAFGTFMDPGSACRMGLLPPQLEGKIEAIGNAAGSGAKMLALWDEALAHAQTIVERTEFVELASAPGFQRCFAQNMGF